MGIPIPSNAVTYCAVPTPAEVSLIRILQSDAARNHRSLPPNHPRRLASNQLTNLIRELLQRGVPAAHLSALFDPPITHQAVRARAYPPSSLQPEPPPYTLSTPLRQDPPAGFHSALIASAPYRRLYLLPTPFPAPFPPRPPRLNSSLPLAPLPVFTAEATPETSSVLYNGPEAFLIWLGSDRKPGAAYVDKRLIHLYLAPHPSIPQSAAPANS